jgi:hypothetical protein
MKILLKSTATIFLSLIFIPALALAGDFSHDQVKIDDLINSKVNVEIPHEIKFLLSLPDDASADKALADVIKKGFKAIELKTIGPDVKDLWVSKVVIPDEKKLMHIHKQLESIAKKYGGFYSLEEWDIVKK